MNLRISNLRKNSFYFWFLIRIVELSLKNQEAIANCSSNTDSRIHSGGINHKLSSTRVLANRSMSHVVPFTLHKGHLPAGKRSSLNLKILHHMTYIVIYPALVISSTIHSINYSFCIPFEVHVKETKLLHCCIASKAAEAFAASGEILGYFNPCCDI